MSIKQLLTEKDVKIRQKTVVHKGFCRVELYELEQKRFDGSWSPVFIREMVTRPNAVGVLPYDPRNNQVVLIEQFRIGALGQSVIPWLIEIVAGIEDKEQKEADETLARREMLEEAGLEAEALLPIYNYFTSPGFSSEKVALFCAKVDATKAPQFCGLEHEHEDIKVHVVSVKDAFAAVRSGQINNGPAIIALQWLELNFEAINKMWSKSK